MAIEFEMGYTQLHQTPMLTPVEDRFSSIGAFCAMDSVYDVAYIALVVEEALSIHSGVMPSGIAPTDFVVIYLEPDRAVVESFDEITLEMSLVDFIAVMQHWQRFLEKVDAAREANQPLPPSEFIRLEEHPITPSG
jgi:hypothetical protein